MKTRQDALDLLEEWVESESLRKHCLGVAVCMEAYAKKYAEEGKLNHLPVPFAIADKKINKSDNNSAESFGNKNEVDNDKQSEEISFKNGLDDDVNNIIDKYWIAGLLHDFDYEKFSSLEEHPFEGCKVLISKGYDKDIVDSIMGHGNHTGVRRESLMAKTLFAVDELSGIITALARVRPGNFYGMTAKSVKKALKKKDFAAAINRNEINQGMEELGFVEENIEGRDEHFELVIKALSDSKKELGFG